MRGAWILYEPWLGVALERRVLHHLLGFIGFSLWRVRGLSLLTFDRSGRNFRCWIRNCWSWYFCSFIDYNDDRYDPRMAPAIKSDRWRKGSQVWVLGTLFVHEAVYRMPLMFVESWHWTNLWGFYLVYWSGTVAFSWIWLLDVWLERAGCLWQWFVLLRRHAEAVVADHTIFPIFRQHCKVMGREHKCWLQAMDAPSRFGPLEYSLRLYRTDCERLFEAHRMTNAVFFSRRDCRCRSIGVQTQMWASSTYIAMASQLFCLQWKPFAEWESFRNRRASTWTDPWFMLRWIQNETEEHNCIPDEHYIQTLLAVSSLLHIEQLIKIRFFLI